MGFETRKKIVERESKERNCKEKGGEKILIVPVVF